MTARKTTYLHLFHLWILALILRLGYLLLAVQNLGLERFAGWAPDSSLYWVVSDHILHGHELGGYALLRVGPGYGLILTGIRLVFGPDPTYPILFSLLMGSLAPVFVYLLAYRLLGLRTVALAAGVVSALSLTSVALSCHILTDQPFFTLFAAALVCYVMGFKTGRGVWFAVSGLIGAIAALIRPSGHMAYLIFLAVPFIIPVLQPFSSRWQMIKRAGLGAAVMLLVVLSWTVRNYAKEGLFVFSGNDAFTVQGTLLAQFEASRTEGMSVMGFRDKCEETDSVFAGHYVRGYRRAKERVINAVKAHPNWFLRAYLRSLDNNIKVFNYFPQRQIPVIEDPMRRINQVNRTWFAYTVMIFALAGLVVLFVDKNYLAGVLLSLTFAYFTLPIGLSFWQGSRLHYPAEMAWSISVVYLLYRLAQIARSRIQRTDQAAVFPKRARRDASLREPDE